MCRKLCLTMMQVVKDHLKIYQKRIEPRMSNLEALLSILDVELFGVSGIGRECCPERLL